MLTVILGVVMFTGIVLALVFVILAARSRLVATGTVDILVNEEKTINARVGGKLLGAAMNVTYGKNFSLGHIPLS